MGCLRRISFLSWLVEPQSKRLIDESVTSSTFSSDVPAPMSSAQIAPVTPRKGLSQRRPKKDSMKEGLAAADGANSVEMSMMSIPDLDPAVQTERV